VRVSFSLTSGVYVSQGGTIAGSNTSPASVNHTHGVPGLSVPGLGVPGLGTPNHQHTALKLGAFVASVGPSGADIQDAGGTSFGAVGQTTTRTGVSLLTDSSGGGTTGGGTTGGGTTGGGTSGGFSVTHVHAFAGGTVAFGAPTALGAAGGASAAHIMLVGTGEMFPLPPSQQPPYGGGAASDFGPFDLTKYFAQTGITYEIQFTTATIGGIIAQVQMVAQLTAS